jgi:hypothetical protein
MLSHYERTNPIIETNTSKLDMVNSDLTALFDWLGEVWVEVEPAEPVAVPVAELVAEPVAETLEETLVDEDELSTAVRK